MKSAILAFTAACAFAGGAVAAPAAPPQEPAAQSAPAPICGAQRFTVYFAPDEAVLTPQAHRAVDALAEALSDCTVDEIRALALSEDAAEIPAGLDLSEARADAVLAALANAGVTAGDVETGSVFLSHIETASDVREPMARRVEVRLETRRAFVS
ncbi:MAG: OmpA family protein [Pseudomonadota bacterium]